MKKENEFIALAQQGKISDGYHTFDELYEHRITLYIALCRSFSDSYVNVWKTTVHSDGAVWAGWFLLGIHKEAGRQISYHLPMKYWDDLKDIMTLERAPLFDGHTSADVLERIAKLYNTQS